MEYDSLAYNVYSRVPYFICYYICLNRKNRNKNKYALFISIRIFILSCGYRTIINKKVSYDFVTCLYWVNSPYVAWLSLSRIDMSPLESLFFLLWSNSYRASEMVFHMNTYVNYMYKSYYRRMVINDINESVLFVTG